MVMASADKKVRYVKCPKCSKILIENSDVPVYQCGGCGTVLQAKSYNATREHGSLGSVKIRESSNTLVDKSSDNGAHPGRKKRTPSSNGDTTESARIADNSEPLNLNSSSSRVETGESHVTGENGIKEEISCRDQPESGGEQYLKEEAEKPVELSIGENGVKEEVSDRDQLESRDAECTFKSQPDGNIQIVTEQCLPVKLSQQGSDNLFSSENLEEFPESSQTEDNCVEEKDSNTDIPAFGQDSDHTAKILQDKNVLTDDACCLKEIVEKSPQKSPSFTSCKLKESSESVSEAVGIVEDIVDEVHGGRDSGCLQSPTTSPKAYEESISSCNNETRDDVDEKHSRLPTERFRSQSMSGYTDTKDKNGGIGSRSNEHQKYSLKTRMDRSLSNQVGSSSRHNHMQQRGTSLGSSDFHSLRNWMGSEGTLGLISKDLTFCDDSFSLGNGTASSKLKCLEEDRLKLLRMVHKLRYQLSRNYYRGERRSQVRTRHLHPSYIGHPRGTHYPIRTSTLQQCQFPHMPLPDQLCSCLQCRLEDDLPSISDFSHDGLSKACTCSICSHPSVSVNPPLHKGSFKHNEKRRSSKRYCRPLSGGAPFVICYKCLEVLQLPADVLISRRRLMKVQCGACSEVLLFSFPFSAREMILPPNEELNPANKADSNAAASNGQVYTSHANECPQGDPVSFSEEHGPSLERSCSTEAATTLDVSLNSSEGRNGKRSSSSALHRLMGYYSATQVMCQPSNSDEEYESAETTRQHFRRPSEAS